MTIQIFTYNNIYFYEDYDKKKLEEEIIKLSPVEFYLFILLNENNIKNKYSTKYYYYLLENYIDYYSKIYDDKLSNKQLKKYDMILFNLICNIYNNLEKKSIFQKKISNYFNDLDNEKYQPFDENIKHKIKQNKKIINLNIFDMSIINFDNRYYNQMKKYLNVLIENNDLSAMLFMALFYKFFEKNNTEEIKYYLKIHKFINEYEIEMLNDSTDIEFDLIEEVGIYLEAMYYLSLYYLENKQYKKAFYISLNTIKFIELHNLISYINDDSIDDGPLTSNHYFKLNISMFYIYFKFYNNIIELSKHYYNYDGEIYRAKYINEIEYIINNWKY